jgi:predicted nuclease of predicted toxin-antitoxin system
MARLYADENFPLPVVEELRKTGHDVLTIQEDGKANQRYPDEDVLSAASANNRALLTVNH